MSVFSPKINPLDPNKTDHWSLEDIVATYGGKGLIFCRPSLSKKTFVKVKLDLANLPMTTLEKLIERTSTLPSTNLDKALPNPAPGPGPGPGPGPVPTKPVTQSDAFYSAPSSTPEVFGKPEVAKADVFGPKADVFGPKPDVFGPKADVFGPKADIYGKPEGKNASVESQYMSPTSSSSTGSDSFQSVYSSLPSANTNANPNPNANMNANANANANPVRPDNLAQFGGDGEEIRRVFNALKEVEVRSDDRIFLVDDKPPLAKALPQEGGRGRRKPRKTVRRRQPRRTTRKHRV